MRRLCSAMDFCNAFSAALILRSVSTMNFRCCTAIGSSSGTFCFFMSSYSFLFASNSARSLSRCSRNAFNSGVSGVLLPRCAGLASCSLILRVKSAMVFLTELMALAIFCASDIPRLPSIASIAAFSWSRWAARAFASASYSIPCRFGVFSPVASCFSRSCIWFFNRVLTASREVLNRSSGDREALESIPLSRIACLTSFCSSRTLLLTGSRCNPLRFGNAPACASSRAEINRACRFSSRNCTLISSLLMLLVLPYPDRASRISLRVTSITSFTSR